MLAVVIILIIITLIVLFLRAGRKRTVIYRKKVAPTERGCSITDHPGVFSASQYSGHSFTTATEPDAAIYNALAFDGGEFGGGGSGDSYDSGSGFENDSGSGESGGGIDSGGNDSSIFSGE
ncbi:hypothetical protein [Dyadobacter sp. OTU695]|uniref:hypothetical protein n=1 Tax=Dyadobacter sp. OTU695 TaxID=3043860 RepID=UPI00313AFB2B